MYHCGHLVWIWLINLQPYELPINLWIQLDFSLQYPILRAPQNLSRSIWSPTIQMLAHSVIIVYSLECVQDKLLCTQRALNQVAAAANSHRNKLIILWYNYLVFSMKRRPHTCALSCIFGIRDSTLRNCNRECIFWFGFERKQMCAAAHRLEFFDWCLDFSTISHIVPTDR